MLYNNNITITGPNGPVTKGLPLLYENIVFKQRGTLRSSDSPSEGRIGNQVNHTTTCGLFTSNSIILQRLSLRSVFFSSKEKNKNQVKSKAVGFDFT